MATKKLVFFFCIFAMACTIALAFDPSPLQDFCVADIVNPVKVNGFVCKNPKDVNSNDFFAAGLLKAGDTDNFVGSIVTTANVNDMPGLNTLGISMSRIDYARKGINPPHTHPRASEMLTVIEGTLLVGFVTSNQDKNRLFSKVLSKGDVFVFPMGMVHFQQNVGHGHAVAIAGLSSQNPGVVTIAITVFGSTPDIPTDIIAKAFKAEASVIADLQSKF